MSIDFKTIPGLIAACGAIALLIGCGDDVDEDGTSSASTSATTTTTATTAASPADTGSTGAASTGADGTGVESTGAEGTQGGSTMGDSSSGADTTSGTTTGGDTASDCTDHPDCTTAGLAQCDNGSCVACTDSPQCAGVTGLGVCDAGTCVECLVGDETACGGGETCDLLAAECVKTAPGAVANCEACTNDLQCAPGHACIPMEFPSGAAHGHYCLEISGDCSRPFQVAINEVSISGAAAVDHCGIDEDLATCEAVNALLDGWFCTGADGMCSPVMGGAEVAVPGSLCAPVGAGGDACTYPCSGASQCPSVAPGDTCGDGDKAPPGWCGG